MSPEVRRGLQLIISGGSIPAPDGGWTRDTERAVDLATMWIEDQLKIDAKRRRKRGPYRGSKAWRERSAERARKRWG